MLPFIDLQSQFKLIQSQVEERVINVLRSGQYILGPEVSEFEDKLAQFAKVKHAVSCSSGTDALKIALMAKGIGQVMQYLRHPLHILLLQRLLLCSVLHQFLSI